MQLLNNLYKIGWKWKDAAFTCYMLSLAVLWQGNGKNPKNVIKIVYVDGENLHIFWTNWGILIKFSGMMWLMIILKITKKQGFILSLEDTLTPASFFGLSKVFISSIIVISVPETVE